MTRSDPYQLTTENIKDPPTSFVGRLQHLGPGFILSASIVGSGELIATTTLGAQAGFVTFWVILVSCFIKVAVQVEIAKHTILTGETAMQMLNKLPGRSFGEANWSIWAMLIMMTLKLFQVGGIIGGSAIILNIVFPQIGIAAWAFIIAMIVASMIFRGYYKVIERFSLAMIVFFTLFTALSVYFLQYTPYDFTWQQLAGGLQFRLPKDTVIYAIGAFGITGVAGEEIIYYNYWCLEKGYARYVGPKEDSQEWRNRAKGWINTMILDAVAAMVIYTFVTALFYILGAAVLYEQGKLPAGYEMIETLSAIYTESLGAGVKNIYLGGAFVVLFSTLFAALASWTRLITDILGQLKWINFDDFSQRSRWVAILAWVIPILWAFLFIYIKLPVIMIFSGGIVGAFILFLIVFTTIDVRYKRTDKHFKPGITYDVVLWASILSICIVGIYGVWRLI